MQTTNVPVLRLLPWLALIGLLTACSGGGDSNTSPSSTPTANASASPGLPGLPAGRVTFYGAQAGDQAGAIISGDFNGDGIMDVALGAPFADGPNNQRVDAGAVYIFFGPFAPGTSLDAGAGDFDAVFYGATAADDIGRALVVGDFNGDGVDDLVMSAPAANGQAGRLYVMFGGKWPRETDFATSDPDVLLSGADAGDYTGFTLAATDLDGDGKSDLIVGSMLADGPQNSRPDSGEVYVVKGPTLIAGSNINLEQTGNIVYGARAGDRLGEGLTTGDVNGDGKPDLVLVATFAGGPDGTRAGAGETYVIASPVTLPLDLATGAAALEVLGADPGDQLGHSIGAGDTDGDGAADLWLGGVSADGPGNATDLAGEAVLVAGKRPPGALVDEAAGGTSAIIYGPEATSRLGRSLAVGDLNGDGHADLAISAPNLDNRGGRVFVFFGGGSYPRDTAGANVVLRGLDPGDILGYETFGMPSISMTDVDGDGRTDLLVSAPGGDGPNNSRTDCGEAYLISGKTLGAD
jgi:hypothetical protein